MVKGIQAKDITDEECVAAVKRAADSATVSPKAARK